jgi:hypothetical protein
MESESPSARPGVDLEASCERCGRLAGRLALDQFYPEPGGPRPVRDADGLRCGACGGPLRYLPRPGPSRPVPRP